MAAAPTSLAGAPRTPVTTPPATVTVRVASGATLSASWEASRTVWPAADAARMARSRRSRYSASSPAWGSSSNHSSGSRARSTARATRRRCPADSDPTRVRDSRPDSPKRSIAGSAAATGAPAARSPKRTFSRAVISSYSALL